MDCTDDRIIKKMALVSPDLPKLVQSLSVHHPKENEILLLGGLESVDTCQTYLHSPPQGQQRGTDVCLVPRLGGQRPTRPDSVAMEINRFLVGLRWGRDRRYPAQGQPCGRRGAEDDTNRSISSIEEDFLTASEQLGDDSEDDAFRNEPEMSDMAEVAQKHNGGSRLPCQRGPPARLESDGVQTNTCTPVNRRATMPPKTGPHAQEESAGLYATNLAESVLQDAFIRLSQDEGSFTPEAAVSVSLPCLSARAGPASCPSPAKQPSQQRTCSFELPKIVIVQSPDSSEGHAEWPETQTPQQVPDKDVCAKAVVGETQLPNLHRAGGHPSKPVEVALACTASIIGTITAPQLTEQIAMESASEGDTEEDLQDSEEGTDYSFSSAMCGMARVAGVVAAVDLTEESGEGAYSDTESPEVYKPSRGLMTAAEASAAFTLHCSVAEGTSIEVFRANIAEVLHREAFQVLAQPQGYKSVAHMLELTHNKIADGITRKSYPDEIEVDEFISEVSECLFRHALDKAKKTKDLEAPKKDAQNYQAFLQESVNNLLFEILCTMQKKISDISRCHRGPFDTQEAKEPLSKLQRLVGYSLPSNSEYQSGMHYCTDKMPTVPGLRAEHYILEDKESDAPGSPDKEHQQQPHKVKPLFTLFAKDSFDNQQVQQLKGPIREPHGEISVIATEKRGWLGTGSDSRQSCLNSYNSSSLPLRKNPEFRTPVTGFADDLATTVVSMATELAAICLDNSTGKQPWFCALKGTSGAGPEAYLLPACRTALRRKEGQNGSSAASKKHRAPRLSEIKRKTEEQPELMERLVNRVVDEAVVPGDETQDPFALFASEVTARIMNCPELSVVDTSKPGQPRSSRLQCERWSRGKASSYESIPEEDGDPTGTPNTLGPGSHLGQNLSRGSSISKQSSCESITDEFSRFMVNQMETEGRGFDLLLDYYAGKNASSILAAAVQQAATKRNGHLNVRASSCLSKQSSTESITEEFYRFMLKDMDKENREYGIAKTKEWSNSLLPPSPRTPFCIRQSSVPDRRSSDSRLSVNSPIKANSFDGFPRNAHGDTLNIYPSNSVSATGLCKSDSCLYQLGKTDQITDMLIHETWSSSIESLMRKNKIIMDPEDSIELEEETADLQPHVQQYANRLAADIVETGKSALGAQPDATGNSFGWQSRSHVPVGERRRGFKQSRPSCSRSKASPEQGAPGAGGSNNSAPRPRGPRDVPLIQIEGDQKEEVSVQDTETTGECPQDVPVERKEKAAAAGSSNAERGWLVDKRSKKRSTSASSEESTGSWAHVTPDEDPLEETSSFIQLSEGNGTSSASSLGLAEQEAYPEVHSPSAVASKEAERPHLIYSKENVPDSSSTQTAGISSRELLLLNCDLDPESVDSELRVALQWIAASELGLPTLYFRMSRDTRAAKFQRVVHLVSQKVWRVADLFSAVVQFCQLHEEEEQRGGRTLSSLFDWLQENI